MISKTPGILYTGLKPKGEVSIIDDGMIIDYQKLTTINFSI
jgi:hypothetical protein